MTLLCAEPNFTNQQAFFALCFAKVNFCKSHFKRIPPFKLNPSTIDSFQGCNRLNVPPSPTLSFIGKHQHRYAFTLRYVYFRWQSIKILDLFQQFSSILKHKTSHKPIHKALKSSKNDGFQGLRPWARRRAYKLVQERDFAPATPLLANARTVMALQLEMPCPRSNYKLENY